MELTKEANRHDPTKLLNAFEKHCLGVGEINEV